METQIKKQFGLPTAIATIVGTVIGSGIFFKADDILIQTNGNILLGALILILGAFGIVFGGLSIAQWAKRCDDAGGFISYAELAYGKKFAFVLGWFQMVLYLPAISAVVSYVAAIYTLQLFPNSIFNVWQISIIYISLIFIMNIISKKLSALFQSSATIIKLIPLFLIAVIGLIFGDTGQILSSSNDALNITTVSSAVVAVAFSYDGWSIAPSICHEIKDAKKNLSLALTISPLIIMVVYVLYFVGICILVGSDKIMQIGDESIYYAAQMIIGPIASKFLLVIVIIAVLGTLNGIALGSSRVAYSLALRKELPGYQRIARLHPTFDVPILSTLIALFFTLLWLLVHYISQLPSFVEYNIIVDDIPIVLNYFFYLALYISVIREAKKGTITSIFLGYIAPSLAISASLFIVIGGLSAGNVIAYLSLAILVVASALIMQKYVKHK